MVASPSSGLRQDLNSLLGKRVGTQPTDEREHFYGCPACGQMVDMRRLGDVCTTRKKAMSPSPPIEVCPKCQNERWICQTHGKPMGHDTCRDEAEPCPACNPLADDPTLKPSLGLPKSLPDGFNVDISRDEPD